MTSGHLHSIGIEARQNELVSFWLTARVATAASIPADVMKLLAFDPGK